MGDDNSDKAINPVPGLEGLFYVTAANLAAADFAHQGMRVVNLSDVARYRVLGGYDNAFSLAPVTARDQILYPNYRIWHLFAKERPVLISLDGFEADSNGDIDYNKYRELAEQDSKKNPLDQRVIAVPINQTFNIPYADLELILPQQVRRTGPIPIEEYLKRPRDGFSMEHFYFEGPGTLNLRRVQHPQEHYQRVVAESQRYLRDDAWMKKQGIFERFAVALFKEYAIAYAFLNEGVHPALDSYGSHLVPTNIRFNLESAAEPREKPSKQKVRIQSIRNRSEINYSPDWGLSFFGEGPTFLVKI